MLFIFELSAIQPPLKVPGVRRYKNWRWIKNINEYEVIG